MGGRGGLVLSLSDRFKFEPPLFTDEETVPSPGTLKYSRLSMSKKVGKHFNFSFFLHLLIITSMKDEHEWVIGRLHSNNLMSPTAVMAFFVRRPYRVFWEQSAPILYK